MPSGSELETYIAVRSHKTDRMLDHILILEAQLTLAGALIEHLEDDNAELRGRLNQLEPA